MTHGTSITIFLPDGNPDGVRLVSKSHWTGLAVAAPRSRYAEVRVDRRRELGRPGVYVLIGPADGAEHDVRIYVGEAEETRGRLDKHHAEKDFWNRMIVFTTDGPNLNKATIRHIESRLLERAAEADRAELDNGTAPGVPPLSEREAVDAEAFLADMLVIFPILGVHVFERLEQTASPDRLHLEGPSAAGSGAETEDGFVVYAGALARAATVESMPSWAENLRARLIEAGTLEPQPDGASLRLASDHVFRSPSAAAAVLLGRAASGPLEWKDASGRSLRAVREQTVGEG